MSPTVLFAISAALAVVAFALVAGALIRREVARTRGRAVVGRAIGRDERAHALSASGTAEPGAPDAPSAPASPALPVHWLRTRLGRLLVADEDRRLIEQCGWRPARAQLIFLVARMVLVVLLPVAALLLGRAGFWPRHAPLVAAAAFVVGYLLPKWLLVARAARQREQVARELPLLVDLLRLLQGVGLSLDQSLQVIVSDFGHTLRALAPEMEIAANQYARGRTREHSLQRLATLHGNDNLAGLVGLLVQIDRHGGAVQEPLQVFGERLREQRRAALKERIGKTTVKMTAVMVTTLLPALIIVTAGPGFLAIIRALGSMTK